MFVESAPVKYLILGGAALTATITCFFIMFLLVSGDLQRAPDLQIATISTVQLLPLRTPDKPEIRKKPERMVPSSPPDGSEFTAEIQPMEMAKSELPTTGSLASFLDIESPELELSPPVKDLVPMYVVRPAYPFKAYMKEIEGFVLVQFTVRENGTVSNAIVLDSEPRSIFDDAAISAVSKFKFQPREVGGDKISADAVQMRFAFQMENYFNDAY